MILIVGSTYTEVKDLCYSNSIAEGRIIPCNTSKQSNINLLITGIGVAQTTFYLTKALAENCYNCVVNVGVAGSYTPYLSIGDVAIVSQDTFADYGIDDNGSFKNLYQVGLAHLNQKPFRDGWLHWKPHKVFQSIDYLPKVKAITVSFATGSNERKSILSEIYSPDIETMEGAAVFYTCLQAGIPFIGLRSISNRVEPRDRLSWNLPLAIQNLCDETQMLLKEIL